MTGTKQGRVDLWDYHIQDECYPVVSPSVPSSSSEMTCLHFNTASGGQHVGMGNSNGEMSILDLGSAEPSIVCRTRVSRNCFLSLSLSMV